MGTSGTGELADHTSKQMGLWKLMLKLPVMRGRLQYIASRDEIFFNLCAAYDDATLMVEKLRLKESGEKTTMLEEYETICSELEGEVISYCLEE